MKPCVLFFPIVLIAFVHGKRDRARHSGSRMLRDKDGDLLGQGQCELEITCKGDQSGRTPVKLPIKGPRGPPGRAGEKGAPGTPGTPGKPGLPGKSSSPESQVAFFVGLGTNKGPVDGNQNLTFDKVVTNIGGAYDEASGQFTAPADGVYSFTIVVAAQGYKKAAVMLMKTGQMIQTVWAESIPSWATASSTAILSLKTGDQVWLVHLARAPYLHGYMYTSFSGHWLFTSGDEDSADTGTDTDIPRANEPDVKVLAGNAIDEDPEVEDAEEGQQSIGGNNVEGQEKGAGQM